MTSSPSTPEAAAAAEQGGEYHCVADENAKKYKASPAKDTKKPMKLGGGK